jgi:radical SAM-linked protein
VNQQRIRIRYTKVDRARFLSARDMTSVWERALRRADLPIAYSEGFTPHAKVSFPDALPLGVASTGEYAELTFAVPIDPGPDLGRLSATLPGGMDITTYLEVPDGAPKLARMLRTTLWELRWPTVDDASAAALAAELDRRAQVMLAAASIEVVKHRPDGDRTIDVRPSLLALRASHGPDEGSRPTTVLRAVLANGGTTVRPTDLHAALRTHAPADAPPIDEPRLTVRVAQGEHVEAVVREALSGQVEPLVPSLTVEAA